MISVCQKEFTQIYPQEGWVEHDPMEIWSSQYGVMMEAVAQSGVSAEEIAGIGITNQRETTVLWDRNTGKPIYNAIVWQCRRTADIVDGLLKEGLGAHIKNVTGLVPDAYFSGSKIKWILDRVEGAIPSRRGSAGSPLAIRRQTACAPSRASQARTSRWNKREVAPRARSWYTSCMMGGALRRRRCLPSARRASRLAWEKRFSLSGLLRFSAAFRQRCCEEGMP